MVNIVQYYYMIEERPCQGRWYLSIFWSSSRSFSRSCRCLSWFSILEWLTMPRKSFRLTDCETCCWCCTWAWSWSSYSWSSAPSSWTRLLPGCASTASAAGRKNWSGQRASSTCSASRWCTTHSRNRGLFGLHGGQNLKFVILGWQWPHLFGMVPLYIYLPSFMQNNA